MQIQLTHVYGKILKEVDPWSLGKSGQEKCFLNVGLDSFMSIEINLAGVDQIFKNLKKNRIENMSSLNGLKLLCDIFVPVMQGHTVKYNFFFFTVISEKNKSKNHVGHWQSSRGHYNP